DSLRLPPAAFCPLLTAYCLQRIFNRVRAYSAMRRVPNDFAAANDDDLRSFVWQIEPALNFVGHISRLLHSYEPDRPVQLRHFAISPRADATRVAMLQKNHRPPG